MTAPKALTEPLLVFEDQEAARLSELDPTHPLVLAIGQVASNAATNIANQTLEQAAQQAAAGVQAAQQIAQNVVNTVANGTNQDAGALTGNEITPVTRGAGLLQTTVTKIAQFVLAPFTNANATDAGAVTGAEVLPLSRGAGLLQTSLTKIAQWVIQTYQGFKQSATNAIWRTLQDKSSDILSTNDFPTVQDAVNAAVSSGKMLMLEPNLSIPQITVSGTLRMRANGKVTCTYDGTSGPWITITSSANSSYIEFAEIDFNANAVVGIAIAASYSTVIVRDAHNMVGKSNTTNGFQGVVSSTGTSNVIDVTGRDILVGTSVQGSIPRLVTTDGGSKSNTVRVKGYNCWVGWLDNGTDNTADYVLCDSFSADGVYNLTASKNMKCNFLQYINGIDQPFVLEGVNPYIGTAVYDGWGFPGLQGCVNAAIGRIHLLPSPDGAPSKPVLCSRAGNTTADIRIGRITGSLTVGLSTNGGALFQFLVGSVNYTITDGIDLNVAYSPASTATNFVTHAAGTNVEIGDVRIRFDDSAATPGSALAWQLPSGANVRIRKWDLDPKSYNYITVSNINLPAVMLPPGQEISTSIIANPSTSFPAGRIYFGTAAPTSGTWNRGDTVFNKFGSQGTATGWRCVASGTPGTWKIMGQNGVASGATASRPTAATMGVANATDWAGTKYFDTTLVAAGKPVSWTGAAWVDGTGTTV